MTIRRAPNLVFPGRKYDWQPTTHVLFELIAALSGSLAELHERIRVLERDAAVNGNGERG